MTALTTPGQALAPDLSELAPANPYAAPRAEPDRRRVEVELAAAVILCALLVRRQLAAQQPEPAGIREQAHRAWRRVAPTWLRFAVPAIAQAYRLGKVDGLGADELTALATDYANHVGDYLDSTSADALAEGMNAQLAQKWNENLAWSRAAAAYGLDKRDMRSYLSNLMRQNTMGADPVPVGARLVVDRAIMARANRIGATEAASARQTGPALAWLWLYRQGRLPADSAKQWLLGSDENHCPVCLELRDQLVAPDQPFVLAGGAKIWAPLAHPGCDCRLRLYTPINKAYDPKEKREPKGSPHGGRWTKVTEREATRPIPAAPAPEAPNPFAPTPAANPFAGTANPFAAAANPFAPAPAAGPFAVRSPFAPSGKAPFAPRPQRRLTRAIVVLAREKPPPGKRAYYMPVDYFHEMSNEHAIGALYHLDEPMVDFSEAATRPIATAGISPWELLSDEHVITPYRTTFDPAAHELAYRMWGHVLPRAVHGWHEAIRDVDNPDGPIVDKLDPHDLNAIAHLAGYEQDEDPESFRRRIVDAVHKMGSGDDSLANAYADYVTWNDPKRFLGEAGARIDEAIDDAEAEGIELRSTVDYPVPVQQVFGFEKGFHPGTEHDHHEAYLNGKYAVRYLRYRSAIGDLGHSAPPLRIGLHEVYLEPFEPTDKGYTRIIDL